MQDENTTFAQYPDYVRLQLNRAFYAKSNIELPYFSVSEGLASNTISLNNREYINFSSYNYLNLAGDPAVTQAAKDAIDHYGTSVSASRVVGGERPVIRDLELKIAQLLGVEDALVFVSGHATNVSTIGYLFNKNDLILYDELSHNSIIQGIKLSGATARRFSHNDLASLEILLEKHRAQYERVLIVVEGLYSMDGDVAPVPGLIALKFKYKAILMVDEAHSVGVLGETGAGVQEHFKLNPKDIDIYMGTLSKALAGCGGYIAGSYSLIDLLKYHASGFVFSVGIAPPLAAASYKAIEIMEQQPSRLFKLRENGAYFLQYAKAQGLDVGLSEGYAIVPVLVKNAIEALRISNAMLAEGVYVQPMIYPAVKRQQSRLRFFITSAHTEQDLKKTIDIIASAREEA